MNVSLLCLEKPVKYTIQLSDGVRREELGKGCWLVVVNAERVPPHIGVLFNGQYSSLNIKGKEMDVEIAVLLRKIEILRIKTVFVKLNPHPVFSIDFLREHFKFELGKYEKVSVAATCFTPVRTFMEENYLLKKDELSYLYQLFPVLYREHMIEKAFGLHITAETSFEFVPYLAKDIEDKINSIEQLKSVQ